MNRRQVTNQLLVAAFLLAAVLACLGHTMAAPVGDDSEGQADDSADQEDEGPVSGARGRQPRWRQESSHELSPSGFDQEQQFYNNQNHNQDHNQSQENLRTADRQAQAAHQQAQASENNEQNSGPDEGEEDADDESVGFSGMVGLLGGRAAASDKSEYSPRAGSASQLSGDELESVLDSEAHGLDSNIANAKIELSPTDMAAAAGHHHHHGHSVHGWLKMGAETGKKGAFKWHDKHPVGGKGRR